jgi:hypothetical protein
MIRRYWLARSALTLRGPTALIAIAALNEVRSAALVATRATARSVAVPRSDGSAVPPSESLVAQRMSVSAGTYVRCRWSAHLCAPALATTLGENDMLACYGNATVPSSQFGRFARPIH